MTVMQEVNLLGSLWHKCSNPKYYEVVTSVGRTAPPLSHAVHNRYCNLHALISKSRTGTANSTHWFPRAEQVLQTPRTDFQEQIRYYKFHALISKGRYRKLQALFCNIQEQIMYRKLQALFRDIQEQSR